VDFIRSDEHEDTSTLKFDYVPGRITGNRKCVNVIGQKYQVSYRIDREYENAPKYAKKVDESSRSTHFYNKDFKRGEINPIEIDWSGKMIVAGKQ
jgi:hypothetical protein